MELALIRWNATEPPAEPALRRRLTEDGFTVMRWSDTPRHAYAPHAHDHDESLCGVRGAITFHIAGADYVVELGPGGGEGGGQKIAEGTPAELMSRRTPTAQVIADVLKPARPSRSRAQATA